MKSFSYFSLSFLFFCFIYSNAFSQNSDVLFSYGPFKVDKAEFLRGYEKNANAKKPSYTEEDLNEYLNLYINYKLKVQDAVDEKTDTISALKKEFEDYKKQLTQSFLTDKNISEELLKETHNRLKTEINASHILINLPDNASPADTIVAWNKIIGIKNRILKGESFEEVATKESQDPSAAINKGNLGYFTALQMVYTFENVAYKTPKGSVSDPVRTKFGYHIVKVNDIRNAQGEIQVAHILLKVPENSTKEVEEKVKNKADSIYALSKKTLFSELVRLYSEDRYTTSNEGKLPWFTTGKMVEEFEKASFALKNKNDISAPVRTKFGYHIIQLIDKKELPTYAEAKESLKKKVEKDSRSEISKLAYINKIKKENNFVEYPESLEELSNLINPDFMKTTWKPDTKMENMSKPMFKIANQTFTQKDFLNYIVLNKKKIKPMEAKKMLIGYYDSYSQTSILSVEENKLLAQNPEFASQLQEYKDGIMLFDLMEKKVWNAAIKDTLGLKKFYENNQSKYVRPESVKVLTVKCVNASIAKSVIEKLKNYDSNSTKGELISTFNTKEHPKDIVIEEGFYERKQNNKIDEMNWRNGEIKEISNASGNVEVHYIIENVTGKFKTLADSKGYIVADFQEYLEKNWTSSLRAKYPVTVNNAILKTLIKK